MGKKLDAQPTLHHDFAFAGESDLNAQIAAFARAHEAAHHQILAMDARLPLGPGRARVRFRIVEKKKTRR